MHRDDTGITNEPSAAAVTWPQNRCSPGSAHAPTNVDWNRASGPKTPGPYPAHPTNVWSRACDGSGTGAVWNVTAAVRRIPAPVATTSNALWAGARQSALTRNVVVAVAPVARVSGLRP